MNILFLTLNAFIDIDMQNIYSDLMKEFIAHGHRPYIVTPREIKTDEKTKLIDYELYSILKVQIGNIYEVSLIEKGISTISLSRRFYLAIRKYLGELNFGLILYSTPPITLAKPVKLLKKYFGCSTYLMLKDIFPQNAVDLGMFSRKGLIYWYFRRKEQMLYRLSDWIGCMSKANVNYIVENNKGLNPEIIEICPNAINPLIRKDKNEQSLRSQYKLPIERIVFIYGGNFGKPQNVDFIIDVLKENENNMNIHFVMVGSGTDFYKIKNYERSAPTDYITVLDKLKKEEYNDLLDECDVGLIFLDHRFTIPNFPSRLLDYLNHELPVLAATDSNTDVGQIISDGNFGWWCESNDIINFNNVIDLVVKDRNILRKMGGNGKKYLMQNYRTEIAYNTIMSHINDTETRR